MQQNSSAAPKSNYWKNTSHIRLCIGHLIETGFRARVKLLESIAAISSTKLRQQLRLWSIHPKYLDTKGLVALWREALLAQKVLDGETAGYRNHPQLIRFKKSPNPLGAIATYLRGVHKESMARNYNFNRNKIIDKRTSKRINVTSGQIEYERKHLLRKLQERDLDKYEKLIRVDQINLHPSFELIDGEIEDWEIVSNNRRHSCG